MSSNPVANAAERRQPWATYGLLVLCAIGWVYSNQLESDVRSSAAAAAETAAAYWKERPYLEPDDIIVERLTAEAIRGRRAEFQRERSRSGSVRVPEAIRSHYQEILDGLTAAALSPLLQLPRYRMGVHTSKTDGAAYLTHIFLHGNWLHLIGNTILLLILGFSIERVWGPALFGVFALLFSLAAAAAFRIGNPALNASLIGTSGMLAGLLAAFTLRFASRWAQAGYWAVIIGGICWLTLPAGFGWGGSVVPGPVASGEAVVAANASFWAIAGGLGCGLVITSMMMLVKIEATFLAANATSGRKPSVEPDLEAALAARASGRSDEAYDVLSDLLERKPDYRAALLAMWEVALELGRPADASRAMLRVVRDEVRRNAPSAVEHWLDLVGRGLHADAEPALLIHIALMLREAGQPIEALRALERALEISAECDSGEIASRVARASRALDRGLTEAAAWRALGSMDLAFKDRENIEALLGELYREEPESLLEAGHCDDAGTVAHRVPRFESTGSDPRAEGPLFRREGSEISDGVGPSHELPLTPANSSGEVESATESAAPVRPAPIDLEIRSRMLRVVAAQPVELLDDGLVIEIKGGDKRKIAFDRVDAISVVAVEALGPEFVIVIDLVLNWLADLTEPLKVIRLRGDHFDPRQFAAGKDSRLDAMRFLTLQLLERTNAVALPDTGSVRGTPFASFADLADYQRTVLSVEEECEGSGSSA